MLIDNKNDYTSIGDLKGNGVKTVVDFIRRYTSAPERRGQMDIVTGFFTIAGLDLLYRELSTDNKYRLILSELVFDEDFVSRVINLLNGDLGIEATLKLSVAAKNAVKFLRRETVQVRAISTAFCHAKTYIYDDKDDAHDYYLMGSSNLTDAGLGLRETANVELNFANTGSTSNEYRELRQWFQTQWDTVAKATIKTNPLDPNSAEGDVKEYFIKRIEECFGKTHTPEEIYYKILFELFRNEANLDDDPEIQKEMTLLQDSVIYRTLFDFQKKGVVSLIKMLRKWNGAILADAVGLGKTFSALAVMKYFQNNGFEVLLLCPKRLEKNWTQYLKRTGSRFERDEFDYAVRFHTDLQNERMENYSERKLSWLKNQQKLLVVIDESHNLRNSKSERYKLLLEELLSNEASEKFRDVKVLLLSATPINNTLIDIRNQFNLIAKGDNAAFGTEDFQINNLDSLFRRANRQFETWCAMHNRRIRELLEMLPENFFDLTDKLLVARTRQMIETTLGENLGFPEKRKPENLYVGLEKIGKYNSVEEIYEAMLRSQLTAYRPTQYMGNPGKDTRAWNDNYFREAFLVKMMATLFMKRLESSWYSCLLTMEKVLKVHQDTLAKVTAFQNQQAGATIELKTADAEDLEDVEYADFTLRNETIDLAKMEHIKKFMEDLEDDVQYLKDFCQGLDDYRKRFEEGRVSDPKLERLIARLEKKQEEENHKVVVFTTFGDTAEYLYSQIHKRHPEWKMALVTGQQCQTSLLCSPARFETVLEQFAPYSKVYLEKDWSNLYERAGLQDEHYDRASHLWKVDYNLWRQVVLQLGEERTRKLLDNEIDILIATDCLSEGQNLQDADLVINYDIHWNPVRLIQRFGRIDRIGSPNKTVGTVNFWPSNNYDEFLNLTDRIANRMTLMVTAGTETIKTDEKFQEMVKDNPLLAHNTKKLLDQIANDSISEIEGNALEHDGDESLGLEDFSLELFRQDLQSFYEKNREFFQRMPAGVFSGFKVTDDDEFNIPQSLVALLGYPRRKSGDFKTPYEKLYLMLQPIGGQPAEWRELSRGKILSFLRKYKEAVTELPKQIINGDATFLGQLSAVIKNWMAAKVTPETTNELGDEFAGNSSAARNHAPLAENVFKMENFDLISWEYINR